MTVKIVFAITGKPHEKDGQSGVNVEIEGKLEQEGNTSLGEVEMAKEIAALMTPVLKAYSASQSPDSVYGTIRNGKVDLRSAKDDSPAEVPDRLQDYLKERGLVTDEPDIPEAFRSLFDGSDKPKLND
jgi:hypothetical protein